VGLWLFGFGEVSLAELFEGLRVPFPALAVFDPIEKYHVITPEHFASRLHDDCYGQLTAKNLLSEKPTMRKVDSSGRRLRAFAVVIRHDTDSKSCKASGATRDRRTRTRG